MNGACDWRRYQNRGAFPRSGGIDDDSDARQRALDFTLQRVNLGFGNSCSFWSSDFNPVSSSIELEVTARRMITLSSA